MSEENIYNKDMQHLGSLEERLRKVSLEIDNLKTSFSKSTEDLSRIQSMLDVGNLGEISMLIERFESQVNEAEKKRDEAYQGAKKYSDELEKEKERLIKLWDAYKNQEEELSAAESKLASFEDRQKQAENEKRRVVEDYNTRITTLTKKVEENEGKIKQFDEYKQQVDELSTLRIRLEEEKQTLQQDLTKKNQTISQLEEQLEKIKEYEKYVEYKEKFDEVSAQYEKEKERLTKLYHLYEETETECKQLRDDNKGWQDWFNSNKEIFDKLFSSVPQMSTKRTYETSTESYTPTSTASSQTREEPQDQIETFTEEPSPDEQGPQQKKRRFLFKK